ncbi:TMV resistance protein N-like [Quercus lobata]|uniref:TMV resistance protein N-like n=1 Tax=Quercus lobata TaxID=97700 RepID=UPI001244E81E|nr:TMV resistance protein N-like [Quercus lobata]
MQEGGRVDSVSHFAVAFAEHENCFQKKKVQIWRNALSDVAKLSRKTLTDAPEGKFIQEIVEWIFTELKDKRSIVYEDCFIGIGSRVEEMNSFLDMNSNDNRFIGICGKSGMGKTTLASVVFDKIRNQFEAWSFLENVKEVSEACGLETLQEQLLCDISKGALRVRDVTKRIQVIRKILCDKKVLIVVDDASEKRYLEALVGKSWFGPRSRIIVITEDEHLLKSYEIQTICKVDRLNNDEAHQLFSHKAHCEIDFWNLVNDFVTYAQGSPLVLKVLGSHLCKRTKNE